MPFLIPQLLDDLDITNDEFYEILGGNRKANIIFYDQSLSAVKQYKLEYKKTIKDK